MKTENEAEDQQDKAAAEPHEGEETQGDIDRAVESDGSQIESGEELVPEEAIAADESREEVQPDQPDVEIQGQMQDEDASTADESETEAAVEFEGDRPIVKELVYQAARGNQSKEEQEESEALQFVSVAEAKSVVEGFLFSCNEPLTVSKLSKLMNNLHPKTVRGLLLELQWEYENRPGALQVVEIAGGYQMSTRAHVAPWMFRMHKHKRRSALSPATLETLAIVAYRQPITKGEIETIRGVESGAPLRTLQDLNLVEASGRREVIGRPQLYVTTEQFLKTFGLKSVADLPSISELKNRFAEEQKLKRVVAEEPKPAALEEPAAQAEELPQPDSETVEDVIEESQTTGDDAEAEGAEEPAGQNKDGGTVDTAGEDMNEDLDEVEDFEEDDARATNARGAFADEDSLDEP